MRKIPNTFDALAAAESRTGPTMSLWEKRNVFREMVANTCRQGHLSKWRRWQLVQYAAKLGLHPVQAGQLLDAARAGGTPRPTHSSRSLSCVNAVTAPDSGERDVSTGVVLIAILFDAWVLFAILL